MKYTQFQGVKLDKTCKIPGGLYAGSPDGQTLVGLCFVTFYKSLIISSQF